MIVHTICFLYCRTEGKYGVTIVCFANESVLYNLSFSTLGAFSVPLLQIHKFLIPHKVAFFLIKWKKCVLFLSKMGTTDATLLKPIQLVLPNSCNSRVPSDLQNLKKWQYSWNDPGKNYMNPRKRANLKTSCSFLKSWNNVVPFKLLK